MAPTDTRKHSAKPPRHARSVLVVGTDDWAVEQLGAQLAAAGRQAHRCHDPGAAPFPCNAFIPGRGCPLDQGVDVAVTIRARPLPNATGGETGVTCALRMGVPVVVAGMTAGNPFASCASGMVGLDGDVGAAVDGAAEAHRTVDLRAPLR